MNTLVDELLVHIFMYAPACMLNIGRVCRRWAMLVYTRCRLTTRLTSEQQQRLLMMSSRVSHTSLTRVLHFRAVDVAHWLRPLMPGRGLVYTMDQARALRLTIGATQVETRLVAAARNADTAVAAREHRAQRRFAAVEGDLSAPALRAARSLVGRRRLLSNIYDTVVFRREMETLGHEDLLTREKLHFLAHGMFGDDHACFTLFDTDNVWGTMDALWYRYVKHGPSDALTSIGIQTGLMQYIVDRVNGTPTRPPAAYQVPLLPPMIPLLTWHRSVPLP